MQSATDIGKFTYFSFRMYFLELTVLFRFLVEKLLNETSIDVNVITGQLDLISATPGTVNWVRKLRWPGAVAFADSERKVIGVNYVLEGYYRKHGALALYWVNRAGHSVPPDNPAAMDWILQRVTKYNQYH